MGSWSCVGWYDDRPTLAEVTAEGAIGLEAFTTRGKRWLFYLVCNVFRRCPRFFDLVNNDPTCNCLSLSVRSFPAV